MLSNTPADIPRPRYHVEWSHSYSIGIPYIDNQHKGFLNVVNDLFSHAAGTKREEEAYFKKIIQRAVHYIKFHLAAEERLMIGTRFSGYAAHKKIHDEFILKVLESVKDFESGKRLVLEKLGYFLRDWILSHIAVMDRQYAAYFRQIATRKPDGKLTITRADIERQSAPIG